MPCRRRQNLAAGREIDGPEHRHQRARPVHVRLREWNSEMFLQLLLERGDLRVPLVIVQESGKRSLFLAAVARPFCKSRDFLRGEATAFGPPAIASVSPASNLRPDAAMPAAAVLKNSRRFFIPIPPSNSEALRYRACPA